MSRFVRGPIPREQMDFRRLVQRGPALVLHSRETRRRVGPRRVMLRLEFRFEQAGELAYWGDQSAMFFLGPAAEPGSADIT